MSKSLEQFRKLSESVSSHKVVADEDFLGFGKISKFVNAVNTIPFVENAEDTYAIHLRVSTDKQAKDGESLETQEKLAHKIVEANNGKVFKVYLESAVSATKKRLYERKEMMEMLTDFQKGHFKNIISYNQDRLFRNDKEAPIALQLLIENGANIYYTRGGINQLINRETLGTAGMITIQVDAMRAKEETKATSNRVADNRHNLFLKGHIVQSFIPYGYIRLDKKDVKNDGIKVIQVEEEVEMIKQVEEFYLNGIGYGTISKWLNGEHTKKLGQRPTKFVRRKIRKEDSEYWTSDTVEGLLFTKFYHGINVNTHHGKEEEMKSIDHVGFRTKERYEELIKFKEEKKSKKKPPRHYDSDFLLKELLFCKECGEKFYPKKSTKTNGQPHEYYYCKGAVTGRRLGTHICSNKNYDRNMIETFILLKIKNYLSKFDLSLFTIDMTKNVNEEDKKLTLLVDDCDKQISQLKKEEKGLKKLIVMTVAEIDDVTDEDIRKELEEEVKELQQDSREMKKKLKEIEEKRSQLLEDIEKDNSNVIDNTHIFNKMREFVEDFENVVDYRKQRLIEEIISKIILDSKGNIEIQYKVDLEEMVKSVSEMAVSIQDTFYGDVSDTTTPKNVLVENTENPLYIKVLDHIDDSNYQHWTEEIYIEARSKFKEFLIGTTLKYTENGRINAWQLAKKTGISPYTAKAYFNYSHFPTEEKMIQVLKPFNTTPEDFVKYLNLDNYIDSNLLFEIMACVNRWYKKEKIDETEIGKEIEKRVEKYKEENTLNRQVIYSTRNVIVEEWVTING